MSETGRLARRRGTNRARALALIGLLGMGVVLLAMVGCSSPEQELLAASQPEEQVLRSLRLAGVRTASVWEGEAGPTVRLELPSADTAADPEIGWRIAAAALGVAYPDAKQKTVQLTSPTGAPLAIVTVEAEANSDTAAVRRTFSYPIGEFAENPPEGAAALGDLENRAYLDAKNRAAEIVDNQGYISGDAADAVVDATARLREAAPALPVPAPGEDEGVFYASAIAELLADETEPSAVTLREEMLVVKPGSDEKTVLALHDMLAVVEAAQAGELDPGTELTAGMVGLAGQVAEAFIPSEGPLAEAVLAAAQDPEAPASATDITQFEPEPDLDAQGVPGEEQVPNQVLASLQTSDSAEAAVTWDDGSVAPEVWPAYVRGDGTVFWRAGEDGDVALCGAAVKGFAWNRRGALLVDAMNVGDILAVYEIK